MSLNIMQNWLLLRVLFTFVAVAAFLAFAAVIGCYKAWRDSDRGEELRTGKSSISKQGMGRTIETVA